MSKMDMRNDTTTYGGLSLHIDGSALDWTDYTVFILMLTFSAIIGLYFGCYGSRQKTSAEYLLGGRTMHAFPVALSLVAGQISGITLIGVPSEVYSEGITYILFVPSLLIVCLCLYKFFIPVYFNINMTSSYEYLEMRFSKGMRTAASLMFLIVSSLLLPQYIYVPALVFNQVTGINMNYISVIITVVCIFYTMIGGVKAVIWTDLLQTSITFFVFTAIAVIGTINAGGISNVYEIAKNGNKLHVFNMDPNPFQRSSFWTMTIGFFFLYLAIMAGNQKNIQRYISVSTQRDANKILVYYWIGLSFITTLSIYGGVLAYAEYHDRDPLKNKVISRPDQIYTYYVFDKMDYIPTLPGFFVAGIFSAALSSLSGSLNTMSGTIYEDYMKKKVNCEKKGNVIMKILVVVLGIYAVALVPVIASMGKIISMSYKIASILGTPCIAMFALGIFVPWANTKGAAFAAMAGGAFNTWITIGSTFSPENTSDVFILYKLSFTLYTAVGLTIAIIVGITVSILTGPNDLTTLDPKLITPPMRRFLPKSSNDDHDAAKISLMRELKQLN